MTGVVVIGSSSGGLHAMRTVLAGLPEAFPAPVVLVQHRRAQAPELLAGLLARGSAMPVADAEDKDPLVPGRVLVAPGGYHLLVEDGHVALSLDEAVRHSRPSLDVTLESAADAYGSSAIGVVLTGANADGAAGLAAIRRRGGFAIVQDPETAERPEMPRAAVEAARPQAILPLEEVAPLLCRLAATLPRPLAEGGA